MNMARISFKVKHEGLQSVNINEIVEPIRTFFNESFLKEEFAFLRKNGHYNLVLTKKFIEFDSISQANVSTIIEIISLMNRLTFDLKSILVSMVFDKKIDQNFNYLLKEDFEYIDLEFLGFQMKGKDHQRYAVSLQNNKNNNIRIKSNLELNDISDFENNFDALDSDIKMHVLPIIINMMKDD